MISSHHETDETDERAKHPPAPKLEAVAAGDEAGSIGAHLESCEACATYVARLRAEAEAFRARTDAPAFADAIRARGATSATATRPARERRGARVVWILGPMVAAAAAVLLWLRAAPEVSPRAGVAPASTASGEVARFKGGLAVAAVRERDGRQERLTGPFEVRPGDRVRIEIAVDRDQAVSAGLLSIDGTWTPLAPPASLSAGTHYSELAARFDDSPTDALLLVGAPADVDRARANRNVEGVVAWRVRSAPER